MPRILLVEDNSAQALRFQLELLRYDLRIDVAGSGSSGIDAARSTLPDVIVLDAELAEVDGYTVCRRLKADPQTTRIPVVLLTPTGSDCNIVEGFSAGAVDSIPKDTFAGYNLVEALRQLGVL